MEDVEERKLLLLDLGELASPSFVTSAAQLCTNAQLREIIGGAIFQLEYYNACGFEDESKPPGWRFQRRS
jgi:hypothetical protein